MTSSSTNPCWMRFKQFFIHNEVLGFSLDLSKLGMDHTFIDQMRPKILAAMEAMQALVKGAIANPDENRMVGHYWLRNPSLAPTIEITQEIEQTLQKIMDFAAVVHSGAIVAPSGSLFKQFLLIGIGGSALGPQLVADALGCHKHDKMKPYFMDNTDPDGLMRTLAQLDGKLDSTLCVVISKSGGTPETRNGMLEAKAAYQAAGLDFSKHAIAITASDSSKLAKIAKDENWIEIFPMWDWVGGRTSVTSAVGLVPAALQGIDITSFLEGACAMDQLTSRKELSENPAAMMSLAWWFTGNGQGKKDMVILPYKDRLTLLSKYLQQLVMESLGKELDFNGNKVNQGIAVYGNKGSTDQHAYIQQLREGLNNFFATFIEVLEDGNTSSIEVEPGVYSGDFLQGFLLGTTQALAENGRASMTITIRKLNAFSLGMLIALFERVVGLYAQLIGINAYHQPGVEAGKKAAATILDLQATLLKSMREAEVAKTAEEWAESIHSDSICTIFKLLERLSANPYHHVEKTAGKTPFDAIYRIKSE